MSNEIYGGDPSPRFTEFLLWCLIFSAGLLVGAVSYKTLTEKPATPFQVRLPAGKAHATASITALPATEADAVLRRLASRTSCIPDRDGLVSYAEVEGCILAFLNNALQAPNTREAQQPAATPRQPDTLDPQTREWYRHMAEKGFYPMVIMVPRERDQQGKPR